MSQSPVLAKEFPTEKALKDYLAEHPQADRGKHTVKKDEGKGSDKPTSDAFSTQWGDALGKKLGRPPTKEDFDVLRGQMTQFVRKEKAKDKPAFDKEPDGPKPDPQDPFVKQWGGALEKQLGRPITKDDITVLRGQMTEYVQKMRHASLPTRVMFRFIASQG